ncbi:DNA polymerase III subunit gamma and tau [Nocardia sp. NPDC050710]|uniref:DNA polymerase III subunit gamma and tau n=1 Tax=Nocardia sp. NPDC050710 TaxID=3157220 RepID=UPI0033EB56C4
MALYRKYRPATFAEVVGQEHVTDPLSTALDTGRISHAYLFSGPRGCGKTSSARILARSLNCVQGPTSTPCGICPSCVALGPGGPGNLDVIELDAASHGGVDDTRELRDRAFYAPAESRYRVFIVDEAHMVTTAGFNALLKIVEEPPAHLIFIFATTEPDKVLPTIRSRTHHYPFRLLPPATMRGLLGRICEQESVPVEEAVYPLVIRAGGGSPRDSLSVLDQLLAGAGPEGVTYPRAVSLLGVTDVALIDDAVEALATDDGAALFGTVDRVMEAGHDPRRFAVDLLERFRDLILMRAVPDAADRGLVSGPGDMLDRMRDQAQRIGPATLARYAELLHEGLGEMRGATAPRLLLEVVCARMLLPSVSDAESATLQRLERLERGIATGAIAPAAAPVSQTHANPAAANPATDAPADAPSRPAPAEPGRRRGAEALAALRESRAREGSAAAPAGGAQVTPPTAAAQREPSVDQRTSAQPSPRPGPDAPGASASGGAEDRTGDRGVSRAAALGADVFGVTSGDRGAPQPAALGADGGPGAAASGVAPGDRTSGETGSAGAEYRESGDPSGSGASDEAHTGSASAAGRGVESVDAGRPSGTGAVGPGPAADPVARGADDVAPRESGDVDHSSENVTSTRQFIDNPGASDTAHTSSATAQAAGRGAESVDVGRPSGTDAIEPGPAAAADAVGGSSAGSGVDRSTAVGGPAAVAGRHDIAASQVGGPEQGNADGSPAGTTSGGGRTESDVPVAGRSGTESAVARSAFTAESAAPQSVSNAPWERAQVSAQSGASQDGPAGAAAAVAPADESMASGLPGAGSDAELLRAVEGAWADIRAKVREFGPTVQALLSGASVSRIDGDVIVFAHQHAPLAKRLSDPRNLEAVRSAVRAVLGRDHEVRWEAGGAATRPSAAAQAAGRSRGAATQPSAAAGRGSGAAGGRGSDASAPPRFSRPSQANKTAGNAPGGGQRPGSGARSFGGDDDIPPPDFPDLPDDPGPADFMPPDPGSGYDGLRGGVPQAPTPEEEQEMLAEAARPVAPEDRRDPDEVALELLRSELGATRLDG